MEYNINFPCIFKITKELLRNVCLLWADQSWIKSLTRLCYKGYLSTNG